MISDEELIRAAKRQDVFNYDSSLLAYSRFRSILSEEGVRAVFSNGSNKYEVGVWSPADKDGRGLVKEYLSVLRGLGKVDDFMGTIRVGAIDSSVQSGESWDPLSFVAKEGVFSFGLRLTYIHSAKGVSGYHAALVIPHSKLMKKVLESPRFND
jgi:hypothetical protein